MKACGCNLFLLVVYLSTTFAHGLSGLFQYDTWDVPSDQATGYISNKTISSLLVVKVSAAAVTADHLTPSTISEANGHSSRPTSSLCEVVFRSDEVVVMNIMTCGKHYVVFVGRIPGVYGSWAECQRQVIRYPGNSYQSYSTREEAEEAFEAFRRSEVEIFLSGLQLDPVNGNRQRPLEGQCKKLLLQLLRINYRRIEL
ncbi:hypothetical protein WN943_023041 [Citrus x changshan-huyou]